jgi:CheY-specific phosphatase CheX
MQQALTQSAILTFEELGFVFAQPDESGIFPAEAADNTAVTVRFNGEFGGQVVLRVEDQMLKPLAANMLGEDASDISLEMQHDALGEIANVICGNFLPEIAGTRAVFSLERPVVGFTDPAGPPNGSTVLDSDEGRADVRVFLD